MEYFIGMTDQDLRYLRNATGYNSGDWGKDNRGWDDGPEESDGVGFSSPISDAKSDEMDAKLAKAGKYAVFTVIAIALLPVIVGAVITASIAYFVLFRMMRYRTRVIALMSAVMSAVLLLLANATGGLASIRQGYLDVFNEVRHGRIMTVFPLLFGQWPLILTGMAVGTWLGLAFAMWQVHRMRKSPWLVESELKSGSGKWMHGFSYRMSPFERFRERKTVEAIKNDTLKPYGRDDLVPLGIETDPLEKSSDPTKNKSFQVVCRSQDEVPKHTMVTGTSGSGKTVTLKSMMTRDIEHGTTIFIIDCKKDPEVAEFVSRLAKQYGRNFYHYSADLPYRIQGNPAGPSSYDPISGLSPDKRVDMFLNIRKWDASASVYRGYQQSFLSKVFATMDVAERYGVLDGIKEIDTTQGEMWTFTQLLDKNMFNRVAVAMNKIDDPRASFVRQQVSELNAALSPSASRTDRGKNMSRAQVELQSTLSSLMVSQYGRWLKGGDGGGSGKIIDISELSSTGGNVVLFSIDAAKEGDTGSTIGSLICTDLANMTETRKNRGQSNPVSVYIDEFQSLPPDCVKSMIQKARSAGVGLTLAFQSLKQISSDTGDDSYIKSLLDTCSNFIFHAGSDYDTGLMAAKIIGDHDVTKYVVGRRNETKLGSFNFLNDRDLQVTQHQEKEWIIDPSSFAQLSSPTKANGYCSEAIVIKKASGDPIDAGRIGASAHKVRMIAPNVAVHEWFDVNAEPIDIDAPTEIRVRSRALANDIKNARMQSAQYANTGNAPDALAEDGNTMPSPDDKPWESYREYRNNQTRDRRQSNTSATRVRRRPVSSESMGADESGMDMPMPETMMPVPDGQQGTNGGPTSARSMNARRHASPNGVANHMTSNEPVQHDEPNGPRRPNVTRGRGRRTESREPSDNGTQMPSPQPTGRFRMPSPRNTSRVPGPVDEGRGHGSGGLTLEDV